MRELGRFRENFHDMYSLRSKFLKTKMISKQLDDLLAQNSVVLEQEKSVLAMFDKKKKHLLLKKEAKSMALAKNESLKVIEQDA